MFFPRSMNNCEKIGLAIVKESNLSYELRFDYSKLSGGYTVNIPELCATYYLQQCNLFQKDFNKYQSNHKPVNSN